MNKKFIGIVSFVLIAGLVLILVGCPGGSGQGGGGEKTEKNSAADPGEKAPVEKDAAIKKVDFKNFTYPWTKDFAQEKEKDFTVKDGSLKIKEDSGGLTVGKILYADLTGDSLAEAIVEVTMTGGNSSSNLVYVYTLENEKPKLLWSFDAGGGAEGGLRAVSPEKGNLVVEIFGDAKLVKGDWEASVPKDKFKGKCCPTIYTKTALKWNGKEFVVEGKPEVLDIEDKT
ncbi:MAG: hypothetical protein R2747_08185 [Pyrinomonadaceae bacterium]